MSRKCDLVCGIFRPFFFPPSEKEKEHDSDILCVMKQVKGWILRPCPVYIKKEKNKTHTLLTYAKWFNSATTSVFFSGWGRRMTIQQTQTEWTFWQKLFLSLVSGITHTHCAIQLCVIWGVTAYRQYLYWNYDREIWSLDRHLPVYNLRNWTLWTLLKFNKIWTYNHFYKSTRQQNRGKKKKKRRDNHFRIQYPVGSLVLLH